MIYTYFFINQLNTCSNVINKHHSHINISTWITCRVKTHVYYFSTLKVFDVPKGKLKEVSSDEILLLWYVLVELGYSVPSADL